MKDQVQTTKVVTKAPLPRISVVDDDPDLLTFFKDLAHSGLFILLGAYSNAGEALKTVPGLRPDVVFIDYKMPDISGIECSAKLTTLLPDLKIILITGHPEPLVFLRALRAGVAGLIVKPFTADDTLRSINEVLKEGVAFNKTALPYLRRIIRQLQHRDPTRKLTQRDEQLIACIFNDMSYKEIGEVLGIATSTVHTHMDHLFEKLGVHSQEELIAKFLQT